MRTTGQTWDDFPTRARLHTVRDWQRAGTRWWCVGQAARSAATRAKVESHLFLLKYRLNSDLGNTRCFKHADCIDRYSTYREMLHVTLTLEQLTTLIEPRMHGAAICSIVSANSDIDSADIRVRFCERTTTQIHRRDSILPLATSAADRPRPPPLFSRGPDRDGGRRCDRLCRFESTMKPIASSHEGIARCKRPSFAMSRRRQLHRRRPRHRQVTEFAVRQQLSSSSSSSSANSSSARNVRRSERSACAGRGRAHRDVAVEHRVRSVERSSDCVDTPIVVLGRVHADDEGVPVCVRTIRRLPLRPMRDRSAPSNSSPRSALHRRPDAGRQSRCQRRAAHRASSDCSNESGRVSSTSILAVCSAGEPKILCHKLTAAGFGGSSRRGWSFNSLLPFRSLLSPLRFSHRWLRFLFVYVLNFSVAIPRSTSATLFRGHAPDHLHRAARRAAAEPALHVLRSAHAVAAPSAFALWPLVATFALLARWPDHLAAERASRRGRCSRSCFVSPWSLGPKFFAARFLRPSRLASRFFADVVPRGELLHVAVLQAQVPVARRAANPTHRLNCPNHRQLSSAARCGAIPQPAEQAGRASALAASRRLLLVAESRPESRRRSRGPDRPILTCIPAFPYSQFVLLLSRLTVRPLLALPNFLKTSQSIRLSGITNSRTGRNPLRPMKSDDSNADLMTAESIPSSKRSKSPATSSTA